MPHSKIESSPTENSNISRAQAIFNQRREKKPIFLCVDILLVPLCKEVHTLRKASSDLASKR